MEDDGLYCVVTAIFAPAIPDPDGHYVVKFAGGSWAHSARVRSEFWIYDPISPPGYGTSSTVHQSCTSLADPPDKQCPEPGR